MEYKPFVSIILPTYNEKDSIVKASRAILSNIKDPLELIVVDDDSPDETWKLVEELYDPRIKLIRRKNERGLATAINAGIKHSRGEVIAWFDCDMAGAAHKIAAMVAKLKDHDLVIGSRYVPGGQDQRAPFRACCSTVINRFASLVLGHGIKDYDSGFAVARRTIFNQIELKQAIFGEYFIEFVFDACRQGFKVTEMPYILTERSEGISKSTPNLWRFLKIGSGYGAKIIGLWWRSIMIFRAL